MGRIGKEVAIRAKAFGMNVVGFDLYWDEKFAREYNVKRCKNIEEALNAGEVVSLHVNLTDETRDLINAESILKMKEGVIILNCARGEIVNSSDLADALNCERWAAMVRMLSILNRLLLTIRFYGRKTQ